MTLTETTSSSSSGRGGGCCSWLRAELACRCCTNLPVSGWFGSVDAANGKTIDWNASFQLGASKWVLLTKFVLWGFVTGSYIYGWVDYKYPYFFMAYLSYWTLFYAVAYLTLSLATSVLVKSPTNALLTMTWIAYTVAAVHGILIVLLYWITEYDPATYTIRYFTILAHGASFAVVAIDGLFVNRVPVRLMHYFACLFFGLLFIAWSLAQGLVPVDNPNKDGDDESLYSILDWAQDPVASAIVSIICLFGAMPLFTVLFWGLSLLLGRRYVVENNSAQEGLAAASSTTKDKNQPHEESEKTEDVENPSMEILPEDREL